MSAGVDDDPERGAALLIVMSFGALVMLVVLALVGRIVTEQRAVARSLADTRAYWAAMGINNYVLSRTMQMGNCGSDCDSGITSRQKGYVAEIKDLQTWHYPDVSAAYQFQMVPTVSMDDVDNANEMRIRTTFAPPNLGTGVAVPEALASMASIRPLKFRYCLVATPTWPWVSGLSKTMPGYQRITSGHRPIPAQTDNDSD